MHAFPADTESEDKAANVYRRQIEAEKQALERVQATPLHYHGTAAVGAARTLEDVRRDQQDLMTALAREQKRKQTEKQLERFQKPALEAKRVEEALRSQQEVVRTKLADLEAHRAQQRAAERPLRELRAGWLDKLEQRSEMH